MPWPIIAGSVGFATAVALWQRARQEPGIDTVDERVFHIDDDAATSDERVLKPDVQVGQRERYRASRRGRRLTRSTRDKFNTVIQSPAELLAQARSVIPDITLDELTGARLAASEYDGGNDIELQAIVDAEVNRAQARKKTLTEHLTSRGTYGKQGGRHRGGKKRKASTRRDAWERHFRAARAVLSGNARGVSRGSVRFFNPIAQMNAHRKWSAGKSNRRHCDPFVILERWSFNLPWQKGTPCGLNRSRKRRWYRQEWVGPIPGIDPLQLMLFRPATDAHAEQYAKVRQILVARFGDR